MINLRQLRYFAKVVELGSITRAAEKLHIAQPSLGVQIKYLEAEMRTPLLERHSRGVSVTAAGRVLYERAAEILRQIDDLPQQVRASGVSQPRVVTLGMAGSAMRILGDDILIDPEITAAGLGIQLVEERSAALQDSLDRGEVDVILCYEFALDVRFVSIPILEEELLFVASPHFFSSEEAVSASYVLHTPLVLSGFRGTIPSVVKAQANRLNTLLEPAFNVHSVSILKKIVAQGRAAAILPMGQVAEELALGTLSCRRIEGSPFYRTLYCARMRDNTKATGEDIDFLLKKLTVRLRDKLGALGHPIGGLSERHRRDEAPDKSLPGPSQA